MYPRGANFFEVQTPQRGYCTLKWGTVGNPGLYHLRYLLIFVYYSLHSKKKGFLRNLKRFFTSIHSRNLFRFRENCGFLRNHLLKIVKRFRRYGSGKNRYHELVKKVPYRRFRKKLFSRHLQKVLCQPFRPKGSVESLSSHTSGTGSVENVSSNNSEKGSGIMLFNKPYKNVSHGTF